MKKQVPIKTEAGEGFLEEFWISELNFLMMKVYYPIEKKWISYNLGKYNPDEGLFSKLIEREN
jgi:hypothetical protein